MDFEKPSHLGELCVTGALSGFHDREIGLFQPTVSARNFDRFSSDVRMHCWHVMELCEPISMSLLKRGDVDAKGSELCEVGLSERGELDARVFEFCEPVSMFLLW